MLSLAAAVALLFAMTNDSHAQIISDEEPAYDASDEAPRCSSSCPNSRKALFIGIGCIAAVAAIVVAILKTAIESSKASSGKRIRRRRRDDDRYDDDDDDDDRYERRRRRRDL